MFWSRYLGEILFKLPKEFLDSHIKEVDLNSFGGRSCARARVCFTWNIIPQKIL